MDILKTNPNRTYIKHMHEVDFHSNIGKSGSECDYGNADWTSESEGTLAPPSEFNFPKVSVYDYNDILDSDTSLNPIDAYTGEDTLSTDNSVDVGMFCERTPKFKRYSLENNHSHIYPLGSDLDGYTLYNFYRDIGLTSKYKASHSNYMGSNLSKECAYSFKGMSSWEKTGKIDIIPMPNFLSKHCDSKVANKNLFIDDYVLDFDIKRKSNGYVDTDYYNALPQGTEAKIYTTLEYNGQCCFSFYIRSKSSSPVLFKILNEKSDGTPWSNNIIVVSSLETETISDEVYYKAIDDWTRVSFICSSDARGLSINVGISIPIYLHGGALNIANKGCFCACMRSTDLHPNLWDSRNSKNISKKFPLNFKLGDFYNKKYLSENPWTMSFHRYFERGIDTLTLTDTIGSLKLETIIDEIGNILIRVTDNTGSFLLQQDVDYRYDYINEEDIFLVYNGRTLTVVSFDKDTMNYSVSLDISSVCSDCFSLLKIQEYKNGEEVILDKDIDYVYQSVLLGGELRPSCINNGVILDTDILINSACVSYSDFVYLDRDVLSIEDMNNIQKIYMTVESLHDDTLETRKIYYTYTIYDTTDIGNLEKVGVLVDNHPSSSVVMFSNNFKEMGE